MLPQTKIPSQRSMPPPETPEGKPMEAFSFPPQPLKGEEKLPCRQRTRNLGFQTLPQIPQDLFPFLFFFFFFRASHMSYRDSQARDPIPAVAANLHHSHSNAGPKPCLQHTPQLTAMLDLQLTEQGQGSNPQPYGSQSDLFPL